MEDLLKLQYYLGEDQVQAALEMFFLAVASVLHYPFKTTSQQFEETVQRTAGSVSDNRRQWSFSIGDGCAVTLVIAGLLVLAQHSRRSLRLAPESSPTVTAVARLPPGRLFTTDSWADYLIYTSPGRRVFFDCRSDMYGPDLVHQYLWITEAKPGWKDLLMKYGIAVALVPKASAISAALASSVEWRLLFADGAAVVFERSECEVSACN